MSSYLDYNATTPIDPRVLETMIEVYTKNPGNADSRTHTYGDDARKIVEDARAKVAALIGVDSDEVFFTSGATESNNIAIQGLRDYAKQSGKKHIITTAIEHKAVLNTVMHMRDEGFDVDILNPEEDGSINPEDVIDHVRKDTLLVSVQHVNNETGIIQPVQELGNYLHDKNVLFHVDATQSCGKLVEEIRQIKYDMLAFSAHKFRGPQGIGALVLKRRRRVLPPIRPVFYGGQQEQGIRPGTTPVALVAGMGKACEIAGKEYRANAKNNKDIKEAILATLNKSGIKYMVNGDARKCIDSTLNIYFDGVASEALMLATKQYCAISNGSACTSKSYAPSYVLLAMGLPVDRVENSVRISWGSGVDSIEVVRQFQGIINAVKELAV